jgi:hypothetical protein
MELGYQGEQLTLHKITDKAVEIKGSGRREPTDGRSHLAWPMHARRIPRACMKGNR